MSLPLCALLTSWTNPSQNIGGCWFWEDAEPGDLVCTHGVTVLADEERLALVELSEASSSPRLLAAAPFDEGALLGNVQSHQ